MRYAKQMARAWLRVLVVLFIVLFFPCLDARWRGPGLIDIFNDINELTIHTISSGLQSIGETGVTGAEKKPAQVAHQGRIVSTDAVYFKDVVGLDNALKEVTEVVDFLKDPAKFIAMGATLPKGILLEGPPGCGKTLIAKAVANEAGCSFFYESASSFVEMYVGVGARRIRELFANARANTPAIVFIDELDAIGAVKRGEGGNEEYRQTINQLLTELDGFQAGRGVVVIAATNYAKALDSALTRAGRFDRIIHIDAPNKESRVKLFMYYLSKLPKVAGDVTHEVLMQLADMAEGLTPVDIKSVVNEAPMIAIRSNASAVSKAHLIQGIERVLEQRKPSYKKNNNDSFFNR